tara:strand:+ start:1600 stop:2097 length:498 start_codon:yes stop_codon:yes gene_type:complete
MFYFYASIKMKIVENLFDITQKNRKILSRILANTPKAQLLEIPKGYRNNIWWNIAHVVVTQQLLVYKMSRLEMRVSDVLVDKFRKGTTPDGTATDEEIEEVLELLTTTTEWVQEDYDKGIFQEFDEYTTSPGIILRKTDDAIAFNVFHEGLHLGSILALQKMVRS